MSKTTFAESDLPKTRKILQSSGNLAYCICKKKHTTGGDMYGKTKI